MVLEKKIFKGFSIYGHGGHLGVTCTKYINFLPSFAYKLHMKFNSNWPRSFKDEELNSKLYNYINLLSMCKIIIVTYICTNYNNYRQYTLTNYTAKLYRFITNRLKQAKLT